MALQELIKELNLLKNENKALVLQKFFKTGKGQYGEGDLFLGITVPIQREIAKKYELNLQEIQYLLNSGIHEQRMISLFILIKKYQKSNEKEKKEIVEFYIKNAKRINNWDLVDLSAPNILGDFLKDQEKGIIHDLAKSNNLWERRISIVSTLTFIKNNHFSDTIKISEFLLNDSHDLIHKATGWMLREVGKRDKKVLEKFLDKYYKKNAPYNVEILN